MKKRWGLVKVTTTTHLRRSARLRNLRGLHNLHIRTDTSEDSEGPQAGSVEHVGLEHSDTRENVQNLSDSEDSMDEQDEDYETAYAILMTESWFRNLSGRQQDRYVRKMLRVFDGPKVPDYRKLLNSRLDPRDLRGLVHQKMALEDLGRFSPNYEAACYQFLNRWNYLQNRTTLRQEMRRMEDELLRRDTSGHSLRERILMSEFPANIKTVLWDKYQYMLEANSEDYGKYHHWLETALALPLKSKEIPRLSVKEIVSRMLQLFDQKIYGMQVAKEEFVCYFVNMMFGGQSGKYKAIGLQGPPGIGKTMMAQAAADVLGLPITKISLGGVNDATFLEGSPLVYIGSEPGCIVRALISMQCNNGIIFFDEIDKISRADKGREIENALLHIIDFTQNHQFRDKYLMDIPIDISNCFFIYSMNSTRDMDPALISRMPIIRMEGYSRRQRRDILEKFLLPEILATYQMSPGDISFTPEAAEYLVAHVDENRQELVGVRELKNILNQMVARLNLYRLTQGEQLNLSVQVDNFRIPFQIDHTLVMEFLKVLQPSRAESYHQLYL